MEEALEAIQYIDGDGAIASGTVLTLVGQGTITTLTDEVELSRYPA